MMCRWVERCLVQACASRRQPCRTKNLYTSKSRVHLKEDRNLMPSQKNLWWKCGNRAKQWHCEQNELEPCLCTFASAASSSVLHSRLTRSAESPDATVQCNLGNHLTQAPVLGRSKLRHRKLRKEAWACLVEPGFLNLSAVTCQWIVPPSALWKSWEWMNKLISFLKKLI